jgi:hypothetical protein
LSVDSIHFEIRDEIKIEDHEVSTFDLFGKTNIAIRKVDPYKDKLSEILNILESPRKTDWVIDAIMFRLNLMFDPENRSGFEFTFTPPHNLNFTVVKTKLVSLIKSKIKTKEKADKSILDELDTIIEYLNK